MAKLNIVTFLWGKKYGVDYVSRLAAGVRKHLRQPHRFVVVTDRNPVDMECQAWPIPACDEPLCEIKGCFARLRLFDTVWQAVHGIAAGDRIVCMDLDSIIVGLLDPLFERPEPFLILQGANGANPCPYNGSLWSVCAGYRPDVWSDFSLDAAKPVPHYEFPDDQAWFAHKLPNAAGWKAGSESGVYAFQKPGWPKGDNLPAGARLVVFPGWRDPSKFTHLPWVKEHWAA